MNLVDSALEQVRPRLELQFTELVLDCVPYAIFFVDVNAQFLYVNDLACSLAGYSREQLLSTTIYNINPSFLPIAWSDYWTKIKQKGSYIFESLHRTQHGWSFPVEISIRYLEHSGKEYGCICVRDMTKFKQQEMTLETTIEVLKHTLSVRRYQLLKLRKASKKLKCEISKLRNKVKQEQKLKEQKAQTVSMVAHELGSPLNMISFSLSLLQRNNHHWTEEKRQPHFEHIKTGVEQIRYLIDEYLVIGKLEAGKLKCDPKKLDLDQFCHEILTNLQFNNTNQPTLAFVSRGNPRTVCLDQKLMRTVLTNLLNNAIKYSPLGGTVQLELCYEQAKVFLRVKDEGIGIPGADLHKLFEPFYRSNNVGDIPGTGLGLTVVKKLVEMQGGQIFVESQQGVGTTFTVVLP
jgi:PAS domain S-box-containing protein